MTMTEADREQLQRMRAKAERAVELLLAFLDDLDGDPDLEPTMGDARSPELDECEPDHTATKPTWPVSRCLPEGADWPPIKRARVRHIRRSP